MLSFEERLAILEKEISSMSQDELYEELSQYEIKGPKAHDFLKAIEVHSMHSIPLAEFGGISMQTIIYLKEVFQKADAANDCQYSLAA